MADELGLAGPDLLRLPLPLLPHRLIQGRQRGRRRGEVDFALFAKIEIAGLVVLRLGHQHEIAERLRARFALVRIREPAAPLAAGSVFAWQYVLDRETLAFETLW